MVNIKTSNIGKIKPPHKNSFLSMLWNQSLVTIKKTFKKFNFSQFSFQEKNQNLKIRHKKLYLDSKNTILPLEFVKISKNNFPKLEHFHKIEKILHLEFKKIVFITKNPLKERLVSNVSLKEVFSPYFFSIFKKVIRRSLFDPRKQWILHQQHKLQCKVNFYSFSSEKIFWIVKNISFSSAVLIGLLKHKYECVLNLDRLMSSRNKTC